MKLLKPGDEVISTNDLYGGTYRLFTKIFSSYGIKYHFVGMHDIANIEKLINNQLETMNSCFEFLNLKRLDKISNHSSNKTALLKNPQLYHFLNKSAMGKYTFTKIGKYILPKKTINWIRLNLKNNLKNWKKENYFQII